MHLSIKLLVFVRKTNRGFPSGFIIQRKYDNMYSNFSYKKLTFLNLKTEPQKNIFLQILSESLFHKNEIVDDK